jgi:hypothetical protein
MKIPSRIEGYAIVSEDGMLANAAGVMPDSLKFETDQAFFERGLDTGSILTNSSEIQICGDDYLLLAHPRLSAIGGKADIGGF